MKNFKIILISLCATYSAQANQEAKDQICLNKIPEIQESYNFSTVIPGGIEGQIQIDKEAKGLKRFNRVGQTLMIDAERVTILTKKRKLIYPTEGHSDLTFSGVHIAVLTKEIYHNGVRIFDMSISNSGNTVELFETHNTPYYFKNFTLDHLALSEDQKEKDSWLLSHGPDRSIDWSHHTFLYPQAQIKFDEQMKLNLFFETDFNNSEDGERNALMGWIENATSGSRIDTCVYFLFN